jgi:hypothetical protein
MLSYKLTLLNFEILVVTVVTQFLLRYLRPSSIELQFENCDIVEAHVQARTLATSFLFSCCIGPMPSAFRWSRFVDRNFVLIGDCACSTEKSIKCFLGIFSFFREFSCFCYIFFFATILVFVPFATFLVTW